MWKRFTSLTTLALLATLALGAVIVVSGRGADVAQWLRAQLAPIPERAPPAPLVPLAPLKVVADQSPQALIRRAASVLDSYGSIVAKLRQRGTFYGVSMIGAGSYLQGPTASHRLRLELTLQIGDAKGSYQQIADGQSLWVRRDFFTETQLGRVDIDGVLENIERPSGETWLRNGFVLGLGGLPALFYGLERGFDFDGVAESQLANTPVYIVRGGWQPRALAMFLPDQQARIDAGEGADMAKLPEQVPDEVLVFLGRDDLFPYRIEFRRRPTVKGARGAASPSPSQIVMAVEFFEVQVNQELEPNLFAFDPGETEVVDLTGVFLAHRSRLKR